MRQEYSLDVFSTQFTTGPHAHIHIFRLRGNLAKPIGLPSCFWEGKGNRGTQRKATQTQLCIISVHLVWEVYLHTVFQVCLAMVSMEAVSLWLRVSWYTGTSHGIPVPALIQSLQPAAAAVLPLTEQGTHNTTATVYIIYNLVGSGLTVDLVYWL